MEQPIPIVHQGKRTAIVIKKAEVQDPSPEWDKVVTEAMRLRDAGRQDEALRLLSDLQLKGVAYPPAILTQANLLRAKGELEVARGLLESLQRIEPDHPAVLFNLAALWLQTGNLRLATKYVNRIDPTETTPEFQRMLADLKSRLDTRKVLAPLIQIGTISDRYREDAEEKPISLNLTLAGALKQIPVQWLNAAAALHHADPAIRSAPGRRLLLG